MGVGSQSRYNILKLPWDSDTHPYLGLLPHREVLAAGLPPHGIPPSSPHHPAIPPSSRNADNWADSLKFRPRKIQTDGRSDSLSNLSGVCHLTFCSLSQDCLFTQHSVDTDSSSGETSSPPTTWPLGDKHNPVHSAPRNKVWVPEAYSKFLQNLLVFGVLLPLLLYI